MSETIGTNVKKLIARKMSIDAIPPGGNFMDGIKFLTEKGRIGAGYNSAKEWVATAIEAVRQAIDPNPFRDADDETIAAEILRQVEEKRAEARRARAKEGR